MTTRLQRYAHDCDRCTDLGTFETWDQAYDLYWCHEIGVTLVARYGPNGPDYISGLGCGHVCRNDERHPLGEAYRRAKHRGLPLYADS